jgi:hypothetical protein
LGLHICDFSTIFYTFYKNQQNWEHCLRSTLYLGPWNCWGLTEMPSVCTKAPGKIGEPSIGSLRAAGGGPRRNPVSSSAGTGQARAEGELRDPWALFRGSLGTEAPPACPLGGAARRRPQERLPRSGCGAGGCHTCFSKENQVQTYMHARIKFHAYS